MAIHYADDKLVKGAEVLDLYRDAGWNLHCGRRAQAIEESIRNAAACVVARDGSRLVGFVMALSDGVHYGHVTELLVRTTHRRRGIGSELLRRLREALGQDRVISIFAEPDAESFYRRLGFASMPGAMLLRPES